MSERLKRTFGFAIVARFTYSGEGGSRRVTSVNQFELVPGQGLLFIGDNDIPEVPLPITKATMSEQLKKIPSGKKLQLLAFVDEQTGGLLLSDGTQEGSFGITRDLSKDQRVIVVELGKMTFAGIWGESKQEAYTHLKGLQKARRRLN